MSFFWVTLELIFIVEVLLLRKFTPKLSLAENKLLLSSYLQFRYSIGSYSFKVHRPRLLSKPWLLSLFLWKFIFSLFLLLMLRALEAITLWTWGELLSCCTTTKSYKLVLNLNRQVTWLTSATSNPFRQCCQPATGSASVLTTGRPRFTSGSRDPPIFWWSLARRCWWPRTCLTWSTATAGWSTTPTRRYGPEKVTWCHFCFLAFGLNVKLLFAKRFTNCELTKINC